MVQITNNQYRWLGVDVIDLPVEKFSCKLRCSISTGNAVLKRVNLALIYLESKFDRTFYAINKHVKFRTKKNVRSYTQLLVILYH